MNLSGCNQNSCADILIKQKRRNKVTIFFMKGIVILHLAAAQGWVRLYPTVHPCCGHWRSYRFRRFTCKSVIQSPRPGPKIRPEGRDVGEAGTYSPETPNFFRARRAIPGSGPLVGSSSEENQFGCIGFLSGRFSSLVRRGMEFKGHFRKLLFNAIFLAYQTSVVGFVKRLDD